MPNRVLLLSFVLTSLLALPQQSLSGQTQPAQPTPKTSWITVSFSELSDHLKQLNNEERSEQIRDWCLVSSLLMVSGQQKPLSDLLYDFSPIRSDYFGRLQGREAGTVRSRPIDGNRLLALGPEGLATDVIALGQVADRFREVYGAAPLELLVFEYRYDGVSDHAELHLSTTLSGTSLYTAESGYIERRVRTLDDLEAFLRLNLDLVHVSKDGDGFTVGGRKFNKSMPTLVDSEDLATLVQGDVNLPDIVKGHLQQRGLEREYWGLVDKEVRKHLADAADLGQLGTVLDYEKLRRRVVAANPYSEFEDNVISDSIKINPPALGFSLDPRVNYPAIARDLESALSGRDERFRKWLEADVRRQFKLDEELVARLEGPSAGEEPATLKLHGAHPQNLPSGESDLNSLLGLTQASSTKPEDSETAVSQHHRHVNAAADAIKENSLVTTQIQTTQKALAARRQLLGAIVQDLKDQKLESFLRLEGYLASTLTGTSIGPGSPAYMIRDLQSVLTDLGFELPITGTLGPKTRDAVRQFQERAEIKTTGAVDPDTWKMLLSQDDRMLEEFEALRMLMVGLEQKNNYQCARYDGLLQNTRVGMTLFYTDLMMKLWSFDYKGVAPKIPGFVPETKFDVSSIYAQQELRHSATRVWLGPKSDGFEFDPSGQSLGFTQAATRIFDASSSPLLPGHEVPATYGADRFSYWWNNHFTQVADYEPQYHRLNELMKWSIVFQWFRQSSYPVLASLATKQVNHNYRFDEWVASEPNLRVKVPLPFMRSTPTKEPTECLSIIESDLFLSMDFVQWLSGGAIFAKGTEVSAALANAAAKEKVDWAERRGGLNYTESRATEGGYHLVHSDGRTYDIQPSTGLINLVPDPRVRFDGADSQLRTQAPLQFKIDGNANRISYNVTADNVPLVNWSATRNGDHITLHLDEGPLSRAAHAVLADEEQPSVPGGPNPAAYVILDDKRMLIKADEHAEWTLVREQGADDRIDRKPVLVLPGAEKPVRIEPLQGHELTSVLATYQRAGLSVPSGIEVPDAPPLELFRSGAKNGGRQVKLTGSFGTEEVKVSDRQIYWQRSADLVADLEKTRTLNGAWKKDGLAAIADAADSIENDFIYVQRSPDASLAYASSGPEINQDLQASIADALPAPTKDFRGVLLEGDGRKIAIDEDGVLHLSLAPSKDDLGTIRQVLTLIKSNPDVVPALASFENIQESDLGLLASVPKDRMATFAEFHSVKAVPDGYALVDLHTSESAPKVMLKRGSTISFQEVDARAFADAQKYISMVYRNQIDPTVAEFLAQTKPLFKGLEQLARDVGAKTIITVEDGPPTAAQLWAMHNGDPAVHFVFDQTSAKKSVINAEKIVNPRIQGAVFISSVNIPELEDSKFASIRQSFEEIRERMIPIRSAATFEDFAEVLADPDLRQITLVVRATSGGLVFRDQWVSYDDLSIALLLTGHKELLHLISNGGSELVRVFANSGHFDRIVYSAFDEGNIEGFGIALQNASDFFSSFARPVAVLSPKEFTSLLSEHPDLRQRLESVSQQRPSDVAVDLQAFFKGRPLSDNPANAGLPDDVADLFRGRIVSDASQTAGVDEIFSEITRKNIKKMQDVIDHRKARDLLKAMPTLKVQLLPSKTGLGVMPDA